MNIDANIFKDNENKWVVTDSAYKRLIASSSKLNDLQKKIKKLNIKDAVVLFVPPFDKSFAPICQ